MPLPFCPLLSRALAVPGRGIRVRVTDKERTREIILVERFVNKAGITWVRTHATDTELFALHAGRETPLASWESSTSGFVDGPALNFSAGQRYSASMTVSTCCIALYQAALIRALLPNRLSMRWMEKANTKINVELPDAYAATTWLLQLHSIWPGPCTCTGHRIPCCLISACLSGEWLH